jgi:hypothetical protein
MGSIAPPLCCHLLLVNALQDLPSVKLLYVTPEQLVKSK